MCNVSGKTRVYGIIGDPVEHSLSPVMQNQAMKSAGIDAVYVPFHVTPDTLVAALEGLRALQVNGVNVTLPHKESILPLLDHIDEDAALVGAVNTVVRRGKELIGFNTDMLGFIRSLSEDLHFDPISKNVLLLGAGGACRAAAVGLLRSGVASLSIINRNVERAEQLAERISPFFPDQSITIHGFDDAEYTKKLKQADLVVNTTSIGLKGEEIDFCPVSKIKASASIYDMVYTRSETAFVKTAKTLGLIATDGLGMLASQGEEAFNLWFDIYPEQGLMKKSLLDMCALNS